MCATSGRARIASIVVLTSVQLLSASLAAAQKPTVTIVPDHDPARESGFNVVTGPEGSFRISRSVVDNTSVTVSYTVSGTATPGADYAALSGTITLGPGIGSAILGVNVLNDDFTERDETVIVTLESSKAYSLPPIHRATVTIIDIDQKVRITPVDTLASEPGNDNATFTFERLGSLSGDLVLNLTYTGTAARGSDYTAPATVTIPAGDSIATLTIVPIGDAQTEGSETVVVTASGSAMIGNNRVTVADAVATVATNPASLIEAQGNTANFVVTRSGNPGQALTVPFTVSGTAINGTDYNTIGSSVIIAAGAASANVPIVVKSDAIQEGGETVILTLGSGPKHGAGVPNSATLLIQDNVPPSVATLALAASSVIGGTPVSATVTLNGPAPAGGIPVTLTSTSTSATFQPASLIVAAGQSSATFTINTSPRSSDATATISAAAPTGATQAQLLTIQAAILTTASLNTTTVTPQNASDSTSVLGTVTLTGPAPSTGTTIQLSSSNPSAASVPASVVIPANQSTATFKVTAVPLTANSSATITATRGTISKTLNLAVKAPAVATLTFNPSTLAGGIASSPKTATGSFTLDGPVPAAGLTATFSDDSDRLSESVPSVFMPGGASSGSLTVSVLAVAATTTGNVTVAMPGGNRNASLTIVPPTPATLTLNSPTIVGGQTVVAHLTLNGNAPNAGFSIPVSSNSAAATPCTNTPISSVSFTGTFTALDFNICTSVVTAATVVTITAGSGASAVSTQLEVRANAVAASSIVLSSTSVNSGVQLTGTVTLTESALAPNGSQIAITSNSPSVKFRAMSSGSASQTFQVTVPAGQSSAGFQVVTSSVSQDTLVTVSASPGTASTGLTVLAPRLAGVTVTPSSVTGGAGASGKVTLSQIAPSGGVAVQLTSSNPGVSLPSIVTIPGNNNETSFSITTAPTAVDATAVITASSPVGQVSTTLTILGPVSVASVTSSTPTVISGNPFTLTVTLSAPAPSAGATVSVSCSSPNISVPSTISISAGQTSTSLSVATTAFGANTSPVVGINATLGGVTRTVQITLVPIRFQSLVLNPTSVTGGTTATGTVQLDRPALGSGLTVTLTSSNTSVTVPASVTIGGGQTSTTFTATSVPVSVQTQATISAAFDQATTNAPLVVRAPDIASLTFSPTHIVGGNSATGTATITGQAAAGGAVVNLSANPAGAIPIPATVTVPAGQTSVPFTVATSADAASVTVSVLASRPGSGGSTAGILTIQSPAVASLTLSATSVQGGGFVTATVMLPAPAITTLGLPVSSSSSAASVPSVFAVNSGQTTTTFTISTSAVTTNTTVTITAGAGSGAKTATLTITP